MSNAPPDGIGVDEHAVFRALFAASPDALLVVDSAGLIVMANDSATELLGYPLQELLGLNVDRLTPGHVGGRHAAYRDGYSLNPKPRPMGNQMELAARRRDGSEVMVEIALSPLQSHGLPFVVVSIRNVATYPRVKQALQRARYSEHLAQFGREAVDAREVQVLLNRVPAIACEALQVEQAVVYLLDTHGTHFEVVSAVGSPSTERVGARLSHPVHTELGCLLASERAITVPSYASETRFQSPESAPWVSGIVVPLSDRGRIVGALAARSLQAQRFADDELRFLQSLSNLLATSLQRAHSEEALNHAQRLESVGQLTGGIAHDFNNLLTIIQGNLQILEELPCMAHDEQAPKLVSAAGRASMRGAELTRKLLAFSRKQVLQPQAVDVQALLQSLADMLRRTLDQRIQIEIETSSCPPCLADAGQLESALLNIAINARDAMPEGGTLRFQVQPCPTLPEDVCKEIGPSAFSSPAQSYVAISVSDTGVGMSDEVKERAFEPFFTTKEAGRGTGLGLSTVYGFIKQSRGGIAIDSRRGHGTTLMLYLPSASHEVELRDHTPASETLPPGLQVLLVEDDAEVRSVALAFLEAWSCKVTPCANGEEALALLATQPGFDVLLTDIALGAGMRGTQLAAQAEQLHPDLRILLMSGYSSELLDADRDSPPHWQLLPKPYSRQELARALVRVLHPAEPTHKR